jgi:metal-responsive CopG/Arc/MetJ family transcriptional regulator
MPYARKVSVTTNLAPDVAEMLDRLSVKTGKSRAALINDIVTKYMSGVTLPDPLDILREAIDAYIESVPSRDSMVAAMTYLDAEYDRRVSES